MHIKAYTKLWPQIFQNLPGPLLQTLVTSLFMSLDSVSPHPPHSQGPNSPSSLGAKAPTYHPSQLLSLFLGPADQAPQEVWHVITGTGKAWSSGLTRSIVAWAAGATSLDQERAPSEKDELSDAGLKLLFEYALARWTDPQHISRALLSEHRCMFLNYYF